METNTMTTERKTYNGWKNYETWNVSLWINNDEPLYRSAYSFMEHYEGQSPYRDFIAKEGLKYEKTPDGADWDSQELDFTALNEMMKELVS